MEENKKPVATGHRYDGTEIFACDPEKNTDCSKKFCFLKGGPCHTTTYIHAAMDYEHQKEKYPYYLIEMEMNKRKGDRKNGYKVY